MAVSGQPSRLLTIPHELRNEIYSYLTTITTVLAPQKHLGGTTISLSHLRDINILLTCKQMHAEMLDAEPHVLHATFALHGGIESCSVSLDPNILANKTNGLFGKVKHCQAALSALVPAQQATKQIGREVLLELVLDGSPASRAAYSAAFAKKVWQMMLKVAEFVPSVEELTLTMSYRLHDVRGGAVSLDKAQFRMVSQVEASDLAALEAKRLWNVAEAADVHFPFVKQPLKGSDVMTWVLEPSEERVEYLLKTTLGGDEGDEEFPGYELEFVRKYFPDGVSVTSSEKW